MATFSLSTETKNMHENVT